MEVAQVFLKAFVKEQKLDMSSSKLSPSQRISKSLLYTGV